MANLQRQDFVYPESGIPQNHDNEAVSPGGQCVAESLVLGLREDITGNRSIQSGHGLIGRLLDKDSEDWLEGHYRTAAQRVDITDIISND